MNGLASIGKSPAPAGSAWNTVGELQEHHDQFREALHSYREAHRHREAAIGEDSTNRNLQRDLARSSWRLAILLQTSGSDDDEIGQLLKQAQSLIEDFQSKESFSAGDRNFLNEVQKALEKVK